MNNNKFFYRNKMSEYDDKVFNSMKNASYKCKRCNRTVIINKQDRALCPDCGYWVYKSDELEFKYKIKEAMIKNGK